MSTQSHPSAPQPWHECMIISAGDQLASQFSASLCASLIPHIALSYNGPSALLLSTTCAEPANPPGPEAMHACLPSLDVVCCPHNSTCREAGTPSNRSERPDELVFVAHFLSPVTPRFRSAYHDGVQQTSCAPPVHNLRLSGHQPSSQLHRSSPYAYHSEQYRVHDVRLAFVMSPMSYGDAVGCEAVTCTHVLDAGADYRNFRSSLLQIEAPHHGPCDC
jgi:hypothetical protein